MPQVARQGDTSDHGGAPIDGNGINETVTVNSKPVAVSNGAGDGTSGPCGLWKQNDKGGPSDDTHPLGRLPGGGSPGIPGPTDGSPTVFVAGLPVHRFNDSRGCGAETITASPNVWADFVDKIRIEGATVNDPIPSPASPKSFTYPPLFFYSFSFPESIKNPWPPGIDPGVFYIPKSGKENSLFTSKTDNTNTWGVDLANFEAWGSEIKPTLEFEDITDEDKFKVPDIDFARRLAPGNPNEIEFGGGLSAIGFPSYGTVPIETVGIVKGVVTNDGECTLFDFWREVEGGGFVELYRTTGYPFKVANESGEGIGKPILITIPWSKFH
tara:strand:+ start:31609 stop:32586 length:978 start_codon:yes stop_codon:yes gene_type:complete